MSDAANWSFVPLIIKNITSNSGNWFSLGCPRGHFCFHISSSAAIVQCPAVCCGGYDSSWTFIQLNGGWHFCCNFPLLRTRFFWFLCRILQSTIFIVITITTCIGSSTCSSVRFIIIWRNGLCVELGRRSRRSSWVHSTNSWSTTHPDTWPTWPTWPPWSWSTWEGRSSELRSTKNSDPIIVQFEYLTTHSVHLFSHARRIIRPETVAGKVTDNVCVEGGRRIKGKRYGRRFLLIEHALRLFWAIYQIGKYQRLLTVHCLLHAEESASRLRSSFS